MNRTKRAEPLAPHERRQAIIEAVLPLLAERGAAVTTRQMAEAAGVAEGTLFSVFPDKRALILAALEYRFDPAPLSAQLGAIDPGAPLEARLTEAARVILDRTESVAALLSVLRTMPRPSEVPKEPPAFVREWSAAVTRGVTALLEPHRERLRLEPERVASAFVALLFASRYPFARQRERLEVGEIVEVLLHGVLAGSRADAEGQPDDADARAATTPFPGRGEPRCS